ADESTAETDGPPAPRLAPRARRAIALLGLAGLDASALKALEAQLEPDPATDPAAALSLSSQIRAAWDSLARVEKEGDAGGNDRVGRVLPALELSPVLDDPRRNP